MADLYLMCGKCGSGKTTFAKEFARTHGYRYLGIDECYEILNGDDRVRDNKFKAWQLFYQRIHICEELGQTVVVDTNAPLKVDRVEFLNWFPNFDHHVLIQMYADDKTCWENNCKRARHIDSEHFHYVNSLFEPVANINEELKGRSSWDMVCCATAMDDNGNYFYAYFYNDKNKLYYESCPKWVENWHEKV